ncbi:MAG: hypothetical protein MK074_01400 [Phycisphaerales bacterium]|nr:hypothetical protein [Phycisphaerales bacterium]
MARKKAAGRVRVIKKYPTAKQRTGRQKLWKDASLLRRLYKEEGKSQGEIAAQLGCSLVTINKAFKDAGIKCERGRRSRALIAAGSRSAKKVKEAAAKLPDTSRQRPAPKVDPLIKKFDELPTTTRKALRQVLLAVAARL